MTPDSAYGRYHLIAEIGRGGMAEVYLAVAGGPAGFNKLFVIKQPLPDVLERPEAVQTFLQEARIAARLNHRNIVQIYEAVEPVGPEGRPYIVMEFMEGQPLSKVWFRRGQDRPAMPLEMSVEILCELLTGLDALHEARDLDGTPQHLIHRDVSPHNLFVTYDGQVKLLDFGLAKDLSVEGDTLTGAIKGKVRYMAPEQACSDPLDHRTDLFSVGMILYRLITGQSLWGKLREMQVLRELLQGRLPEPAFPEGVDPTLAEICRRALAKAPADRHGSASEMRAALQGWLGGRATSGSAGIGAWVTAHFSEAREKLQQTIKARLAELEASGTLGGPGSPGAPLAPVAGAQLPSASGARPPRLTLGDSDVRSGSDASLLTASTVAGSGSSKWVWAAAGGLVSVGAVVLGMKLAGDPTPRRPVLEEPRLRPAPHVAPAPSPLDARPPAPAGAAAPDAGAPDAGAPDAGAPDAAAPDAAAPDAAPAARPPERPAPKTRRRAARRVTRQTKPPKPATGEAPPEAASPATPEPTPAADPAFAPGKKPHRTIDTTSPY